MNADIQLKRIYAPMQDTDGARVLTDRLWPRGIGKNTLSLNEWYPHASPSAKLRRDWHQKKIDYATFCQRYQHELAEDLDRLQPLLDHARQGRLTLLTAARDPMQSHLPTLRQALLNQLVE